jgi:alkylhydroperoxidase family enzyme
MADQAAEDARAPRISPLTEAELSEDAMALATKLRANFGLSTDSLPDAVATMLRHPDYYRAQIEYVTQRAKSLVLAPRDLEILILRTAWLCQSAYSWGEHVNFGKKAGLASEEIERLTQGSVAPGWSERDRAVVRLAEELHETCFVSDETWGVIAENFSDKEIIEMLVMAGFYREVAYLYNTMRVRLIPGNPGLSAR